MRMIPVLFAALLLVVCMSGNAAAHSTKGLMKAPLNKDTLKIDDVAFFVESYVMRELYDDKSFRFIVKDFVALKQDGNRAVVDFVVLDKKENRTFPEKLTVDRGAGGVWSYRPKNGEPVTLFTYVAKGGQAGGGSTREVVMGGMALAAVLLGGVMIRKKLNSGPLAGSA